jgi:hypothetical protein
MKKVIFCIVGLAALLFGGIHTMGLATTISGARHVIADPGFGAILQNAKLVVISWPYQGYWAFVVFPRAGATVEDVMQFHNGMALDVRSSSTLMQHWLDDGFKPIDSSELPVEVKQTLFSAMSYITAIGTHFPAFMMIPIILLEPNARTAITPQVNQ